ncbi:hypothetical protein CBR_g683 [Chara braunii]|uniref:Uncharacterized protein n=1 Tax=Chara braunii TaxID=69332 RepID=A0A388KC81_CHABU|nr:hypothetical protein CBR_g683 [Chara braunii]|eukprot:GBG67553.1 hypothetical protein CBR_g683 [Chara braunii]
MGNLPPRGWVSGRGSSSKCLNSRSDIKIGGQDGSGDLTEPNVNGKSAIHKPQILTPSGFSVSNRPLLGPDACAIVARIIQKKRQKVSGGDPLSVPACSWEDSSLAGEQTNVSCNHEHAKGQKTCRTCELLVGDRCHVTLPSDSENEAESPVLKGSQPPEEECSCLVETPSTVGIRSSSNMAAEVPVKTLNMSAAAADPDLSSRDDLSKNIRSCVSEVQRETPASGESVSVSRWNSGRVTAKRRPSSNRPLEQLVQLQRQLTERTKLHRELQYERKVMQDLARRVSQQSQTRHCDAHPAPIWGERRSDKVEDNLLCRHRCEKDRCTACKIVTESCTGTEGTDKEGLPAKKLHDDQDFGTDDQGCKNSPRGNIMQAGVAGRNVEEVAGSKSCEDVEKVGTDYGTEVGDSREGMCNMSMMESVDLTSSSPVCVPSWYPAMEMQGGTHAVEIRSGEWETEDQRGADGLRGGVVDHEQRTGRNVGHSAFHDNVDQLDLLHRRPTCSVAATQEMNAAALGSPRCIPSEAGEIGFGTGHLRGCQENQLSAGFEQPAKEGSLGQQEAAKRREGWVLQKERQEDGRKLESHEEHMSSLRRAVRRVWEEKSGGSELPPEPNTIRQLCVEGGGNVVSGAAGAIKPGITVGCLEGDDGDTGGHADVKDSDAINQQEEGSAAEYTQLGGVDTQQLEGVIASNRITTPQTESPTGRSQRGLEPSLPLPEVGGRSRRSDLEVKGPRVADLNDASHSSTSKRNYRHPWDAPPSDQGKRDKQIQGPQTHEELALMSAEVKEWEDGVGPVAANSQHGDGGSSTCAFSAMMPALQQQNSAPVRMPPVECDADHGDNVGRQTSSLACTGRQKYRAFDVIDVTGGQENQFVVITESDLWKETGENRERIGVFKDDGRHQMTNHQSLAKSKAAMLANQAQGRADASCQAPATSDHILQEMDQQPNLRRKANERPGGGFIGPKKTANTGHNKKNSRKEQGENKRCSSLGCALQADGEKTAHTRPQVDSNRPKKTSSSSTQLQKLADIDRPLVDNSIEGPAYGTFETQGQQLRNCGWDRGPLLRRPSSHWEEKPNGYGFTARSIVSHDLKPGPLWKQGRGKGNNKKDEQGLITTHQAMTAPGDTQRRVTEALDAYAAIAAALTRLHHQINENKRSRQSIDPKKLQESHEMMAQILAEEAALEHELANMGLLLSTIQGSKPPESDEAEQQSLPMSNADEVARREKCALHRDTGSWQSEGAEHAKAGKDSRSVLMSANVMGEAQSRCSQFSNMTDGHTGKARNQSVGLAELAHSASSRKMHQVRRRRGHENKGIVNRHASELNKQSKAEETTNALSLHNGTDELLRRRNSQCRDTTNRCEDEAILDRRCQGEGDAAREMQLQEKDRQFLFSHRGSSAGNFMDVRRDTQRAVLFGNLAEKLGALRSPGDEGSIDHSITTRREPFHDVSGNIQNPSILLQCPPTPSPDSYNALSGLAGETLANVRAHEGSQRRDTLEQARIGGPVDLASLSAHVNTSGSSTQNNNASAAGSATRDEDNHTDVSGAHARDKSTGDMAGTTPDTVRHTRAKPRNATPTRKQCQQKTEQVPVRAEAAEPSPLKTEDKNNAGMAVGTETDNDVRTRKQPRRKSERVSTQMAAEEQAVLGRIAEVEGHASIPTAPGNNSTTTDHKNLRTKTPVKEKVQRECGVIGQSGSHREGDGRQLQRHIKLLRALQEKEEPTPAANSACVARKVSDAANEQSTAPAKHAYRAAKVPIASNEQLFGRAKSAGRAVRASFARSEDFISPARNASMAAKVSRSACERPSHTLRSGRASKKVLGTVAGAKQETESSVVRAVSCDDQSINLRTSEERSGRSVSSDSSFYQRGITWKQKAKAITEQRRQEKAEQEMRECTFKPSINTTPVRKVTSGGEAVQSQRESPVHAGAGGGPATVVVKDDRTVSEEAGGGCGNEADQIKEPGSVASQRPSSRVKKRAKSVGVAERLFHLASERRQRLEELQQKAREEREEMEKQLTFQPELTVHKSKVPVQSRYREIPVRPSPYHAVVKTMAGQSGVSSGHRSSHSRAQPLVTHPFNMASTATNTSQDNSQKLSAGREQGFGCDSSFQKATNSAREFSQHHGFHESKEAPVRSKDVGQRVKQVARESDAADSAAGLGAKEPSATPGILCSSLYNTSPPVQGPHAVIIAWRDNLKKTRVQETVCDRPKWQA